MPDEGANLDYFTLHAGSRLRLSGISLHGIVLLIQLQKIVAALVSLLRRSPLKSMRG